MGVRILDEDGSLIFEFRDGLGKPLLGRLLRVAKFVGEAQPEIIINEHVALLGLAIEQAMENERPAIVHAEPRGNYQSALQAVLPRLFGVLSDAILSGGLPWPLWSNIEKRAFVRSILVAPIAITDQELEDTVEEIDLRVAGWRQSLNVAVSHQ